MKYLQVVVESLFIVIFIAVFVLVQSTYKGYYNSVRLTEIKVNINDSTHVGLVDRGDILRKLSRFSLKKGVTFMKDISLSAIENSIAEDDYINRVEVYSDVSGALNIDVEQFVPVMRIIDKDGLSYFIDDKYRVVAYRNYMNLSLPLVSQESDAVPISYLKTTKLDTEKLTDLQKKSYQRIDDLSRFLEIIQGDDIWRSMVSQVYLNSDGEVELIPRIGAHSITFCEIDSLSKCERYFDKLLKFYKDQTNSGVWTQYSNVNLKYEGQVVCKKIKK